MSNESPVSLHKTNYRGLVQFQLKWTEEGKEREAHFHTEAEAVMETAVIEERLRVAALAGQGYTVNPFGAHIPFINSKDVHYASLKLQPRGLKFREVIDDYVSMAAALKIHDVTPQQAVFEWLELKKQAGDAPLHEVLRVYLKAKPADGETAPAG